MFFNGMFSQIANILTRSLTFMNTQHIMTQQTFSSFIELTHLITITTINQRIALIKLIKVIRNTLQKLIIVTSYLLLQA
jgi:hypothetical protein